MKTGDFWVERTNTHVLDVWGRLTPPQAEFSGGPGMCEGGCDIGHLCTEGCPGDQTLQNL